VDRIHIVGASGSGTSTLAAALGARLGHAHLDTDRYYWEPSDPPFQRVRERGARAGLLAADLDARPRWVLSGSLCGWGDVFIPRFQLVIFLAVPADVRMARLRARERARYGAAVEPGGAMHRASQEFLDWAARYDEGGMEIRSRRLHEAWLAALPCPCLRLEGPGTVDEHLARVAALVSGADGRRADVPAG
jgi:adenylate kinase family enzyme